MIYIPTPELGSPARHALEMEGVENMELLCAESTDYGNFFATLWDLGQPFVICEHDIIPWPGSTQGLQDCPEPWCLHRYPLHKGNVTQAWGFSKYRPEGPVAPTSWSEVPWHLLDGYVIPVLHDLFGGPHVHEPPVAHARQELAA